MKLRLVTLLTLSFIVFSTAVQAQVAYPRFQKHTVLEGETAQGVADQFHVSLTDFCLLNDFPEDVKLKPYQVVLVKQLKEGEEEIIEDVPLQKVKPVRSEPAKTEPAKTVVAETTKTTTTKTTTTTITEKPKPVVEEKPKPAPVKTTAVEVVEKPKPVAVKKQAADEPFVVPPPSTKAVEVGPHGVKYNVSKSEYHIVEKNQTFFRIALIYGMSVDELKELNGLSNTTVEIGQKLKVRK